MHIKRPVYRVSIIVATCVAAMLGVYGGVHGYHIPILLLVIMVIWTVIVWRSAIWWIGLIVIAIGLGSWRGEGYQHQLARLSAQIGQSLIVEGTVVTDPVTDEKHRTQVRLASMRLNGHAVPGIIRVTGRSLRLERGFKVVVTGRLKPGFATWDGEIDYGKVTVVSQELTPLELLRQRFFTGMRATVPDPEAAFGLGLLVGVGALIPKPLQVELTRVGLSHLTAVSGYNLTIIIRLVTRMLRRLGPNVVMVISLWMIGAFVIVAGASASIVRAGAVSSLSLLASRSGLQISPTVLISTVATATLLYNPSYLRDAGWALSFLAFFGILVVAPAIIARFGEPHFVLGRMLIETLCAEAMTLPYVLVVFGQLSVIGIVANIVVEPVIPLAMAVAALAAVVGMWCPAFIEPVGFVAVHLLGFILALIGAFSAIPWAQSLVSLPIAGAIIAYGFVIAITWMMVRRSAHRPPFDILEPDRSKTCLDTQNGPP